MNKSNLIITPDISHKFGNTTIRSTIDKKTAEELRKKKFVDRWYYEPMGITVKRRDETLQSFVAENEFVTVNYAKISIDAQAYATYFMQNQFFPQSFSMDFSALSPSSSNIITMQSLAENQFSKEADWIKIGYSEKMSHFCGKTLADIMNIMQLQYEDRENAGIFNFTLNPESILRVRELSWIDTNYGFLRRSEETAQLGFTIRAFREGKVIDENYSAKINVRKTKQIYSVCSDDGSE